MAKSSIDDEIDRLFQLPLAEFTAARNALAKSSGQASIRDLEKPNAAAWAVNQLYWRKRPAFSKLVAAAEKRRAAHGKMLSGKGGGVDDAESAHKSALRAAADEIRALLAAAGETASGQTMSAVIETLEALPGSERPGRFTRPLKLAGFEALAGLVSTSARTLRALTPPPKPAPDRGADESPAEQRQAEKRAEATRRQQIKSVEKDRRTAEQQVKKTESALAAARRALAAAKSERDRLQDQLQFAMKKIESASSDVRQAEEQFTKAGQELAHFEAKLESLDK